jgi:L-ornithine N5-oxygenase
MSLLENNGGVQDLICVGFGPASLAIAIALQESDPSFLHAQPKVAFLERQSKFAWHSGMQLPGARMQISFLKDLATPRNPQSRFTFINYLYAHDRLNHFINLGTFLPTRLEYQDYLRWCANFFEDRYLVTYGQEVVKVIPDATSPAGKVSRFRVISKNTRTSEITTWLAKRVVIAVGGKAMLPQEFLANHPAVIHSSKYSMRVHESLNDQTKPYNIAVIGSGQSAAEIFNDLPSRYPNANVTLIIKGSALRPSDDSPFVNEIFDPDRVDGIYQQDADTRAKAIALDRATNYSVVRLELLEHLYSKLYSQRLQNPNPADWKVRIKTNSRISKTREASDGRIILQIEREILPGGDGGGIEELAFDVVFVATGYVRNAHEDMLRETRSLLRKGVEISGNCFPVRRDYKVDFDESKLTYDAGVWLQGCNESTHGVSN